MTIYKFRAEAVTDIDTYAGGRCLMVELDMTTPQAKEAFLGLAGDCRGDELTMWMECLGYTISEIDPDPVVPVGALDSRGRP